MATAYRRQVSRHLLSFYLGYNLSATPSWRELLTQRHPLLQEYHVSGPQLLLFLSVYNGYNLSGRIRSTDIFLVCCLPWLQLIGIRSVDHFCCSTLATTYRHQVSGPFLLFYLRYNLWASQVSEPFLLFYLGYNLSASGQWSISIVLPSLQLIGIRSVVHFCCSALATTCYCRRPRCRFLLLLR